MTGSAAATANRFADPDLNGVGGFEPQLVPDPPPREAATTAVEVVAVLVAGSAMSVARDMIQHARAGQHERPGIVDLMHPAGPASAGHPVVDIVRADVERLRGTHRAVMVVVPVDLDVGRLRAVLAHVDRVLILGSAAELSREGRWLRRLASAPTFEAVVLGRERLPLDGSIPVRKVIQHTDIPGAVGWLVRHVSRTKVGVAFGAGGAKGFAHVGVLAALESAGVAIDAVAGTSIGAVVGACVARGLGPLDIDAALRDAFDPDAVQSIFRLSLAGTSSGAEVLAGVCRTLAGADRLEDLPLPLAIMAADLRSRRVVALREGPLAEALMAATALPGFVPAVEIGGGRYADAVALAPLPVGPVAADADIVVAVDLTGEEGGHRAGRGSAGRPTAANGRTRSAVRGALEALLDVLDLAQDDASRREAAKADIVVAPRPSRGTWRDFHLADEFIASGRVAAEAAIPTLREIVRALPTTPLSQTQQGRRP